MPRTLTAMSARTMATPLSRGSPVPLPRLQRVAEVPFAGRVPCAPIVARGDVAASGPFARSVWSTGSTRSRRGASPWQKGDTFRVQFGAVKGMTSTAFFLDGGDNFGVISHPPRLPPPDTVAQTVATRRVSGPWESN